MRTHHQRIGTGLGMFMLVALGAMLGGCAGSGQGDYEGLYGQRQYGDALKAAEDRANASEGADRQRAALTAGMAAYALNKPDRAAGWLAPLQTSADPEIAGRANWTLGQMDADRGQYKTAASLLSTAGRQLKDDDAARAAMQAGDAYRQLKSEPEAQRQYTIAQGKALDPAVKSMISSRQSGAIAGVTTGPTTLPKDGLGAGGFTIQLGAYAKRETADAQAMTAADAAKHAGTAKPAVVPTTDPNGQTLYAVRIGQYPTRENAQTVLNRLGVKGVVIAVRK